MLARRTILAALAAAALAMLQPAGPAWAAPEAAFRQFIEALWPEAQAAGVSRAVFDRAFRRVEPDLSLPDLILPGKPKSAVKGQAEFVKPPQAYVDRRQIERLSGRGKDFMAKNAKALERIEREIGVERHVVMGIWGRETAFGSHRLRHYAVQALATQAYLGRRKDMFRGELIHALKMLQDGVIAIENMRSSWAGALGQTQFMPSEFYLYAYDLDRDGRKDIWNSVEDGLASAANQLKGKGWVTGLPWGFEVVLPGNVDCAHEGPPGERSIAEWVKLGVKRADGKPVAPELMSQTAYMMSPGGTHGPIFLVTQNFKVIRLYNTSDLYALFVGHLADRIAGGGDFVTPWKGIGQLPTAEISETQERLKKLGYAISIVDGMIGSNTRRQIGLYQRASGGPVDCWPSQRTLQRLRTASSAD
ncbi:MAG: lytic murein transglycosylase [Hyphomicrobiaceae bacterium]